MYDIIIIGGGIVGLATGLKIKQARPNLKVVIVEKEKKIASHQTGHNSGVIHSGLYYKPGSLKALNCISGYQKLLSFCDDNEIPYEVCGKIVVATKKDQLPIMNQLHSNGEKNGLKNLRILTKDELKEHEPYVEGIAGLHVPQTGIIDFGVVAEKIGASFQDLGGLISTSTAVMKIGTNNTLNRVTTSELEFEATCIVNCAGLYADKIANLTGLKHQVRIIPFRGEYYKLRKEKEYLVRNLIYPVPDPNFPFLGVHFTRMINGGIEAGPNAVLAFGREAYRKSQVNLQELYQTLIWPGFRKMARKYWYTGLSEMYRSFSKSAFTSTLKQLLPDINEHDLVVGGAGVRAQACDRNGKLIDDFFIVEDSHSVHILNAPSPAATSSLAIGDVIAQKVLKRF